MADRNDLVRGDYVKIASLNSPVAPKTVVCGKIVSLEETTAGVMLSGDYGLGDFKDIPYDKLEGPIPDRQVPIGAKIGTGGRINIPELGM